MKLSSAASSFGHVLPFKSQHEINVIDITFWAVIYHDLFTPQLVGEDQEKFLNYWSKSRDWYNNPKPASRLASHASPNFTQAVFSFTMKLF